MLERLRMQEVSQIILSVPEGAVIAGTNLKYGEPVMIIDKPSTSKLVFATRPKKSQDGRGFISASGQTQSMDFTINEGTILYSVWSYLHGYSEENSNAILKGTEWIERKDGKEFLPLSAEPIDICLYGRDEEINKMYPLIPEVDYRIVKNTVDGKYYVQLIKDLSYETYFASYTYEMDNAQITTIKQIHNNIFCSIDIYFDAVDVETDDKHTVCIHCDKVQVFTDLSIGINDSTKASFTPIEIHSIPQGDELNKDVAIVTVI